MRRMEEGERTSDAHGAFNRDLAAEQGCDFAADRKAQTRAAELARRSHVGLLERLEDHVVFILRNADAGIGHRKGHGRSGNRQRTVVRGFDVQRDRTFGRELERV